MTHAIAITRSELRQVIEDYIAASRVGDTLSYVETAKLSTAEAAESSTARIWDGLEALVRNVSPAEPATPEVRQVLYALDRQIAALTKQSDDLARARDYSAEFPAADAEALQQARRIVIASAGAAELPAEQGEPDEDSPKWLISEQIKGFMDGLGGPEDNRGIQDALQSLGLSTETALAVMWRLAKQFTCAEDLAAGQVVIVNSRGMIEGKRDEADNLVHQVAGPRGLISARLDEPESADDFF